MALWWGTVIKRYCNNFIYARIILVASCLANSSFLYAGNPNGYNTYYVSIPDDVSIPDNGTSVSSNLNLSGAPSDAVITKVKIYYEIRHTYPGDLDVWLTANYDGGWHDYFLYHQGDLGDSDDIIETMDNLHTWDGASPNQTWYLTVRDRASGNIGYIDFFELWITYQSNTLSSEDPQDGDTDVSITTNLNWSCSDPDSDTVYYTVYLAKNDSSPDNVIKNDATEPYANPGTLDYNSHYYWRVKADDHNGGVTWGPVWDFYTINTYSIITASAGSGGSITPSGAATVNPGADQSFTIAANTGYHISDVLVDGASVGAVTSYPFTNVTADHTIEASFAIDTYSLTVLTTDGFITKSPDKASYNYSETVTLDAIADTGYSFVDWSGDLSGSANPAFITMDADKSLTANFAINTYSITASAGNGGQISPSGNTQVNWSDTQSYTITANTGYHISDVLVDGSSVGAVSSYSFINVTSDHTIAATFAIDTYSITASAGFGGTITPSGAVTVNSGADQSFTIAADAGYSVADVLVDGASVGVATSYPFTNVTADHTIEASFAIDTYAITASAGSGGTITPSGAITVNSGADQSFTIAANTEYHISDVLVDGSSVGAVSSYSFINVTSDHTIAATFAIDTYSITASAGSGGTITPSGAVTVNSGADQSFTIAADAGYSVADVLVDGASVGAVTSYPFTNVTADHTIEASFMENEPYHPADPDSNNVISMLEYLAYIDEWSKGNVTMLEVLEAMDLWSAGHYYWDESEQKFKPGETTKNIPITILDDSDGEADETIIVTLIGTNASHTYTIVDDNDETDPNTYGHIPEPNSVQVARDTIIQLHITDEMIAGTSGVDPESIKIQVEDLVIYNGDVATYNSALGVCRRTGTAADYTFIFQPSTLFDYEQKVDIEVSTTDKAGNEMTETYYFYTVMRSFAANAEVNSDIGTLVQNRPATSVDSAGNIWVVWDQTTAAGDTDIYIGKLQANGSTFQTSVPVIKGQNDQRNSAIAIDGSDKIYVTWEERNPSDPDSKWNIFVAPSTNGINWTTSVRIDPCDYDQVSPAIAIDGNNKVYITWEDNRAGNKDIWVATSTDATNWTAAQVTTHTSAQTEPTIAIDDIDDIAYIFWTDARNADTDLYGVKSTSWSNNVPVVNTASNQSSPVGVISDGVIHLLWVDDENGYDNIFYGNNEDSLPFTGTTIVDESNYVQSAPAIAVNGTKLFACWQDARWINDGDVADIYFAEKSGSDFGTNIFVNDEDLGNTQAGPDIGIDKDGNPYIVWIDDRNKNNDIFYTGATVITVLDTDDIVIDGDEITVQASTVDNLQVTIPAGALPECVDANNITIAEVSNLPKMPSGYGDFGTPFKFGPSGLHFDSPVTIRIPHSEADCPGYSIYRIYRYDPSSLTYWSEEGIHNPATHSPSGVTPHYLEVEVDQL